MHLCLFSPDAAHCTFSILEKCHARNVLFMHVIDDSKQEILKPKIFLKSSLCGTYENLRLTSMALLY